jgi:hypothetical protein
MDENLGNNDIRVVANFNATPSSDCVIVSYPRSPKVAAANPLGNHRQWNFSPAQGYGATDDDGYAIDDVYFVSVIANYIALYANGGSGYNISRAALVGFSGGGFLALRVLCEGDANYFYLIYSVDGGMMSDVKSSYCSSSIGLTTPYVKMMKSTAVSGYTPAGYGGYICTGSNCPTNGASCSSTSGWTTCADRLADVDSTYSTSSVFGFLRSIRHSSDDNHYYAYSGTVDGYTSYVQYATYDSGTYNENDHVVLYVVPGSCSGTCGLDVGATTSNWSTGSGHRWPNSPCGTAGSSSPNNTCGTDAFAGTGIQSNAIDPTGETISDLLYGP